MRHEFRAEGPAFRLRPVTMEDATFIVGLRTEHGRNRYIHSTSPRLEDQERWLEAYFERPDDYYFVVETLSGRPEGLIGIYYCNGRDAEWGRWIVRSGSLAALESAMLIYEIGFEQLGLEEVYCRTAAVNHPVVSFHDSMNVKRVAVHKALFELPEGVCDAIEHRVTKQEWEQLIIPLRTKAGRLGSKVGRPGR